MEGEEIIRAYLLEAGDVFKRGAYKYRVRNVYKGKIYYYHLQEDGGATMQQMGANSREKLILITNKTKQNEHQN